MKLQRGKFLVKNIEDINNVSLNDIIDLAYMGKFEYEGNAIPISRMFIEYYMNDYTFYQIDIYNKNNERMYIYANSGLVKKKLKDNPHYIEKLASYKIDKNISLWEYINHTEKCTYDFWWDIEGDYFIFFGDDKKDIINYFINDCYKRDGGKEEIKKKLLKIGYKL